MNNKKDIVLIGITAILIIAAWLMGSYKNEKASIEKLRSFFSSYTAINEIEEGIYLARKDSMLTYITKGEGRGYGGLIQLWLETDSLGQIQSVSVYDQTETHSFFQKVKNKGFTDSYIGERINTFENSTALTDAISGASYTSKGIHQAIINASGKIGKERYGLEIALEHKKAFRFGIPEICLIILYLIGFYLSYYTFRKTKLLRWIAIFISIIGIGFIGKQLLTLSQIGSYLLSYWPDFYEFSFWYIVLAGLFLGLILKGRNYYCDWVCPFGACQEILAKIGNARTPKIKYREQLRWVQRILALLALSLGLIFRNPSLTSYEIFSGLFVFTGSDFLFIALAVIIILSLFINKPWCNYLCPIKPSIDYLRKLREVLLKK